MEQLIKKAIAFEFQKAIITHNVDISQMLKFALNTSLPCEDMCKLIFEKYLNHKSLACIFNFLWDIKDLESKYINYISSFLIEMHRNQLELYHNYHYSGSKLTYEKWLHKLDDNNNTLNSNI